MSKPDPHIIQTICSRLHTKKNLTHFVEFCEKFTAHNYSIPTSDLTDVEKLTMFKDLLNEVNLTIVDKDNKRQGLLEIINPLKDVLTVFIVLSFTPSASLAGELHEYFRGLGYEEFVIDFQYETTDQFIGCKVIIEGNFYDCTVTHFIKDAYGKLD